MLAHFTYNISFTYIVSLYQYNIRIVPMKSVDVLYKCGMF